MELISIRDLYRNQEKYVEQTVTVGGWLRSVRDSKTFGFLVVHDGTFSSRFRWYIQINLIIFQQFPN